MPAAIKTATSSWVAVASGVGTATLQFNDNPGEWYIHTASSGAPGIGGLKAEREKRVDVTLAAGEFLHIRGRGDVLVRATTVI